MTDNQGSIWGDEEYELMDDDFEDSDVVDSEDEDSNGSVLSIKIVSLCIGYLHGFISRRLLSERLSRGRGL